METKDCNDSLPSFNFRRVLFLVSIFIVVGIVTCFSVTTLGKLPNEPSEDVSLASTVPATEASTAVTEVPAAADTASDPTAPTKSEYRKAAEFAGEALTLAEQYAKEGNYEKAIQITEEAWEKYGFRACYDATEKYKKAWGVGKAEQYAEARQYRQAIQTVSDAWKKSGSQDSYDAAAQYRKSLGQYNTSILAAGHNNTIVIDTNGNPTIVGRNDEGELAANSWVDIFAVSIGNKHVIGLKSDGTVVAAGSDKSGRCNVKNWENVEAICAGNSHTVALLSDGSLVATGYNNRGQCDVEKLMDAAGDKAIVSIAAGYYHTIALLEDGTVVSCGKTSDRACSVQNWTDIAAIFAGDTYSAGLKTDGTVVICGDITSTWQVSKWNNIVNLSAGDTFLVGITEDGDVLFEGTVDAYLAEQLRPITFWSDIIAVAAGSNNVVALTKDKEIVSAGYNNFHQSDLCGPISEISKFKTGAKAKGISASERSPSADQLVLARKEEIYRESYPEVTDITEFRYDSAGHLVWEKVPSGVHMYSYYDTEIIKESTWYDKEGNYGGKTEYDKHGNETVSYDRDNSPYFEYTNHYNAKNQLLKREGVGDYGDGTYYSLNWQYNYYNDGSIKVSVQHNDDYGGYDTTARFSKDGILMYSLENYYDEDGNLQSPTETTVTFDYRGYPIKEVSVNTMSANVYHTETTEYVNNYDSKGRISKIKEHYYATFEEDGKVENCTDEERECLTEYTYDSNGRLVRKLCTYLTYEHVMDNIWEYDKNGNLIYFKGYHETSDIESFFEHSDTYPVEEYYTYLPLIEVLYEADE